MGSDDLLVLEYLKHFARSFTGGPQVCQEASTQARYAEDPEWALPVLRRLEAAGHLEADAFGQYRITPALHAKYLDYARGARHLDGGCQAVAQRIIRMTPEDDEKTFNALIREALSSRAAVFPKDQ